MTDESKPRKRKERISLDESRASLQRTIDSLQYFKPVETRGVKPGTKRGPYQPRGKGVIKDKNFITNRCIQCGQEFTYKRKGKRLKDYCSDACRQKHYRLTLKQKHLEKQRKVQVE